METGLLKALILAVGLGSVARAGMSYLPLTGPPALRMQVVKAPKPAEVAMINTTKLAKSAMSTNAETCVDTNTAVNGSDGSNLGRMPAIPIGAGNALDGAPGATVFAMPEEGLSGMTPEMLATYFTPAAAGTNGVAIAAPFRIDFIPPFGEPDKSSHAEYIVK
jgi:hypothetical protein